MLRLRTRRSLGFIQPCLPSPAERPPSGNGWIHEIKHDGFRILARQSKNIAPLPERRFPFASMR
jgi:ATP-dependent DNA ligase